MGNNSKGHLAIEKGRETILLATLVQMPYRVLNKESLENNITAKLYRI